MKFTFAFLCFTFFFAMQSSTAQTPSSLDKQLDGFYSFYERALGRYKIAGSSFAFIRDSKVLGRKTVGLAHVGENRKVGEETIFHWASITKTLTGIAIMQLRDRGEIKLSDPITKYVPELRRVHNEFGSMDEITIAQLMSHSAGFRAGTWPWGGDEPWHPAEPKDWASLVAMMPYTEIEFKPGSKYSYSNPGIVFLGRVIEVVSGEDFEVYMDKNVLRPLGMYSSYYDKSPPHLVKNRSHSYWISREGKTTEGRFDMDTGITVSNGGLNAPFPDMIKYINFLIGDPKRQTEYDIVLKRSSLEEMFKPVIEVSGQPANGKGRRDHMGLLFFIEDNFDQHFIGHSGTQNGFRTHFFINPSTRSAYILAFNTWTYGTTANPEATTHRLDEEVKNYLFEKVFPAK
ncbi:MAG: serine hydrolase domain-containing protein [Pyrinomonadaceae bacterium]